MNFIFTLQIWHSSNFTRWWGLLKMNTSHKRIHWETELNIAKFAHSFSFLTIDLWFLLLKTNKNIIYLLVLFNLLRKNRPNGVKYTFITHFMLFQSYKNGHCKEMNFLENQTYFNFNSGLSFQLINIYKFKYFPILWMYLNIFLY